MFSGQLLLGALAAVMTVSTAVFVKWGASARTPLRASVVVFLLLMMTGMLVGALVYLLEPAPTTAIEGLWVASAIMSASAAIVFAAFFEEARRGPADELPGAGRSASLRFVGAVVGLVLVNELLMGWTFGLAAGGIGRAVSLTTSGTVGLLGQIVASPWFLFTMAAEMVLTAVFLRDRLPGPAYLLLLSQSVIMFLSPPALAANGWVLGSIVASSAAMIALFVYLMEFLYRHRTLSNGYATYVGRLLGVYALMMAGLFLWQEYSSPLLFALAVVLEMVVFFDAVVRPERLSGELGLPWTLRPGWTFGVLAMIFVAELFMGAVLDLALLPSVYAPAFPSQPLVGGLGPVVYNAVYNGFWFIATVAGSTWFLAMMGLEMGALVLFKFRETGSRENKVRMSLMIASYAAFAAFFPSFYYSALFPTAAGGTAVPVLGWSMGLGSAPIVPSLFSVILVTYLIIGSLSALFGRRVVCSVFCTAPLMYQGTTVDAMKSFNRTSSPARKYLSSRFSSLYSATTGVTMASLVAVSFLSYFDQTGVLNVMVLGTDPSVFFFALSFSVLWYILFVTIPYTGTYNCVTMGWCYTGTISAAFQKLGFFKLKVRDRQVCRDCTTLDCAKGCPVGLVDMPGHFRTTGEFRSTKCCGVGDCVEACPHDNLYISDARHWIRRRLGWPETRTRNPARVPHAPSRPASSVSLGAEAVYASGLETLPMMTNPAARYPR